MTHILFVTGEYPPMQGGVGDCTNEIANALAVLGFQVSVLTSTASAPGYPVASPRNAISVHRIVPRWDWNFLSTLRRILSESQADIVHIQYQTAAFGMNPAINLAPRMLKSPDAKFVVTYHDLRVPYLFPKAGPVREWVTYEMARSCDATIVTNEEDYGRLTGKLRAIPTLIPIGSNIAPSRPSNYDRSAWRARWGIGPSETLLAYFGFLNKSKGGETLIRALAQLPEIKLIMVGASVGASDPTNSSDWGRVKRLIAELGLTSRVLWTDYMPAEGVSGSLLAADICVLPYRDGVSFRRGTFMAALAHGLPIVTTSPPGAVSVSGSSDVSLPRLCDGENVLLVPPDQPEALAAGIRRLAGDAALRSQLACGALELALAFTWDKIAAQHASLYRRLTGTN
ncbi:MAG: glycosyltransferase family 4 protein [Anaerolineae bacterium]